MHFPMAWRILEDLLFLDTEPELPVSVGVIDTVFSTQTPDLHYGGALYAFTEQELRKSIAKEKEDSKPYKQKVHGTHVAGIIGSDGYTHSGVDGAYPYAWHRKIMTNVSRLFLLSEWGAEAAEEDGYKEDDAEHGGVDIEVFGDAAAHAGDAAVGGAAGQTAIVVVVFHNAKFVLNTKTKH